MQEKIPLGKLQPETTEIMHTTNLMVHRKKTIQASKSKMVQGSRKPNFTSKLKKELPVANLISFPMTNTNFFKLLWFTVLVICRKPVILDGW